MRSNFRILVIFFCCAAIPMAQAQYSVVTSVLASGVERGSVGAYTLTGTIGQATVGATQVGGVANAGGFWNQYAKAIGPISLPTKTLIYYSRGGSSTGTIWVTSGDGLIDSQVTTGIEPRISHGGRFIAFHGGTESYPGNRALYVYDLQTKNSSLVFFNNVYDWLIGYCWSPDDSIIIHDYSTSMHWTKRDGSANGQWFYRSFYDDAPALKPGTWTIAFCNIYAGIMIADSIGANYRAVPNTSRGFWPIWSPDGQWIAFGIAPNDSMKNYSKIRPDGSDLTVLTSFADSEATFFSGGAWTPDGSKLLLAARIHGVQGIYALAVDGSGHMDLIPTTAGDPIQFVGSITGGAGGTVTDVRDLPARQDVHVASEFRLDQSFPNPFNPSTTISFTLPSPSRVRLTIYDVLGVEVRKLIDDEVESPGFKNVRWDASGVASGTYFYKLQAISTTDASKNFTQIKKMLLIR